MNNLARGPCVYLLAIAALYWEVLDSLDVVDPGALLSIIGPNEGTLVLGAPIGSDEYVRAKCEKRVQDLAVEKRLLHNIYTLPQQYYLLLQKCFQSSRLAPCASSHPISSRRQQ